MSATSADERVRLTALDWAARGVPAVVVEVGAFRGSVPRETGTRMLVSSDQVAGTVGGGHLELKSIEWARALLEGTVQPALGPQDTVQEGPAGTWRWQVALGPTLGQCCGGALTLEFAPLTAERASAWPPTPLRFHLQLYGAGHVGRAVVELLKTLPCRVQWIDHREAEFSPDPLPSHIEKVFSEPGIAIAVEVASAPPGACYLVMTHSHDLDAAITEAILRRGDFRYLGLIGSRTKRARFVHRFEARGLPAALLARMTCPIGIDGIRGKEPEIVALSAVAQLLRHGP